MSNRSRKPYVFAPEAPAPGDYSHAVVVDPETHFLLLCAGQTGATAIVDGKVNMVTGVGPQTELALVNALAVVAAAGGTGADIVACDVFLLNPSDGTYSSDKRSRIEQKKDFDAAYTDFFSEFGRSREERNLPARTLVWVAELPTLGEETQVEIKVTAAIPKKRRAADAL